MKKSSSETIKLERKTVERNRRIHMKDLCFKLASLLPQNNSKQCNKETTAHQDQFDLAASHITRLRDRIEKLKARKKEASNDNKSSKASDRTTRSSKKSTVIEIKEFGCCLEVVLTSAVQKNFMLHEVIGVLEQEGAEVITASFSTVGDKVFHTLHARVKLSRVGVETTRVWQRLQDLVY